LDVWFEGLDSALEGGAITQVVHQLVDLSGHEFLAGDFLLAQLASIFDNFQHLGMGVRRHFDMVQGNIPLGLAKTWCNVRVGGHNLNCLLTFYYSKIYLKLMITCNLHGELAHKYGTAHQLNVRNVREVIRALDANYENFAEHLFESAKRNIVYHVVVDGATVDTSLNLLDPIIETIDITPAIEGSGTVGKLLLGVGLLAASAFMPATFLGIGSGIWGATGASLAFGAIGEWIAPAQKSGNDTSYRLDGSGKQIYQGDPVPLAFGLDFVWAENPPAVYFVQNETLQIGYDVTT
jgi:predicted phage tail protein